MSQFVREFHGLDRSIMAAHLPAERAVECLNADLSLEGALQQRTGLARASVSGTWGGLNNPIRSLFALDRPGRRCLVFFRTSGTLMYAATPTPLFAEGDY